MRPNQCIRVIIVLSSLLISSFSWAQQPFRFTAIPDEDETRLIERFERFASYLESTLGVEVEYIPVKSYAAAVTAFRNNQVQLAWFGGLSGVQARSLVPGSQAIAQGYEDQFFVTYFIAHASTELSPSENFPSAIADKTFTFGSRNSTSGRLMPEHYIREYFSRSPDEVFRRVGFSNNHSRTIALVQSGAYEVGAVNYQVWQTELEQGRVDPDLVSVIWETPSYPDYQWTIRGDVNKRWGNDFDQKVTAALLNLEDSELLGLFPRSRFIETSNSNYQPIEDVARSVGILD
jgi:phosphonate transport system substrate-binding protein